MDRRDFTCVSIRGMVTYCVMCLENYVLEAYADHDFVRNKRAALHISVRLDPNRGLSFNGGAKSVARGKMIEAIIANNILCLSPFTGSRRSNKYYSHFES